MRALFIFLLILLTNLSYSQFIFPEKICECKLSMFYMENDSIFVDYQPRDSLITDIVSKIEPKYISKLSGDICIQMLVYANGRSCCMSILNNSNISTKKLKLPEIIGNLNRWTIRENPKKFTTASLIYRFFFNPNYIGYTRLGFKYKDKPIFTILDSREMKRKKSYKR